MALSWLSDLRKKWQGIRAAAAMKEEAAKLSWEYVDRPPGWCYVDTTYSLSSPVGYEVDPAVVKAIQSFCPDYVPCWEKKTFLPPYDDASNKPETFVRHCIARRVRDPRVGVHVFPKMEIPPNYYGDIPNYLELVLEGEADKRASDLPGAYIPLDFIQVERLRQIYNKFKDLSAKEYARQAVTVPLTERDFIEAKRKAGRRAAEQYVTKGLTKYIKNAPDLEVRDLMLGEQEELRKGYVFMPARPFQEAGSTPAGRK